MNLARARLASKAAAWPWLLLMLLLLLLSVSSIVASGRRQTTPTGAIECEPTSEFYFRPTSSCKNCSDLLEMFESYQSWLNRDSSPAAAAAPSPIELETSSPRRTNGDASLSASNNNNNSAITRSASSGGGGASASSYRNVNVKEVSILKSTGSGVNYINNNDDVELSRLISNLEPGSPGQEYNSIQEDNDNNNNNNININNPAGAESGTAGGGGGGAGGGASHSSSSSSSSSSSFDSSNSAAGAEQSLDLIRRQTKQVIKFVSQFIRSQRVIGDELLGVMDECKRNQNTSACQMWSNLCVMTMYSHSDASPFQGGGGGGAATGTGTSLGRQDEQPWSNNGNRKAWQHCRQFTVTSICNSLREWHRQERKSTGADALQSIYATDELGAFGKGSTSGGLIVRDTNQPIQLLAYRYKLDGSLAGVDQFGLHELERFCPWFARDSDGQKIAAGRDEGRRRRSRSRLVRFGRNMRLNCGLSQREAFALAGQLRLNETDFVDLYIAYPLGGSVFIRPVPVLIKSLLYNGNLINQKYSKDFNRWKLVHRFFYHSAVQFDDDAAPDDDDDDDDAAPDGAPDGDGIGDHADHAPAASGANKSKTQQRRRRRRPRPAAEANLLYARSVALDLKFRRLDDKGALLSSILLTIDYGIVSCSLAGPGGSGSSSSSYPPSCSPQATAAAANGSGGAGKFSTQILADDLDGAQLDSEISLTQSLLDMQAYKRDLDLAITILSILSSIWSLIKCYNIQKCYGNVRLDLEALIRFVIIGCDTVANLLLAVIFIFLGYLFMVLKFQHSSVLVLAPNEQLESAILLNLQLALAFKLVGLTQKLYVHLNVDLFFVDWERPKMLTSTQLLNMNYQQQQQQQSNGDPATKLQDSHGQAKSFNLDQQQQQQQQQVSFWRPYTVINRWFQMQTMRRLDITLQLMLFVIIVHSTHVTQLASADPSLAIVAHDEATAGASMRPCTSASFRVLILSVVYLGLASLQILYRKYFHEPIIRDAVREFVDLCSVANVSLFCMLYPRYGYYVHGRNANGSGDRGIAEMNALLEREARDLCSKRGLAPNSDQQTFILILPKVVNDHYRNLLCIEQTSSSAAAAARLTSKWSSNRQLASKPAQSPPPPLNQQTGLFRSALNLSTGGGGGSRAASPAPLVGGGGGGAFNAAAMSGSAGGRGRIDTMMARHRTINAFLINFLEHVYRDIDYSIRDGRRFENLLLDFDFGDEAAALASTGASVSGGTRSPLPTMQQQQQQQQTGIESSHRRTAATFCKDQSHGFASLLWLGLELDLALVELLSFLVLDLWLGQPALILTGGLVWLLHHAFKALYVSCARYNLITKALIDEKFLFR